MFMDEMETGSRLEAVRFVRSLPFSSKFKRRLFGIDPEEVTFEFRGFRGGDGEGVREGIEKVGHSFMAGYHAGLEEPRLTDLVDRLGEPERAFQGFAHEGAAMALALLDALTPWRRDRFRNYLEGAGDPHVYMAHVGAGWAIARLPFGMQGILERCDPLLRWLAFDGYGFHQGYFHWPLSVVKQQVPWRVRGYARRAFDQGLGRSLWFVDGADVERIPATIASFPASRHSDLWGGIGLSSTYAGGVPRDALVVLQEAAGSFRPQLAQGSAFACKARLRAGNATPHTEVAAEVLCGMTAAAAAAVTDRCLAGLGEDGEEPAFEVWRRRIGDCFIPHHSTSQTAE